MTDRRTIKIRQLEAANENLRRDALVMALDLMFRDDCNKFEWRACKCNVCQAVRRLQGIKRLRAEKRASA